MKPVNFFFITILSLPFLSFGQTINSVSINYHPTDTQYRYTIINLDTNVTHYVIGKYGEKNYKKWDTYEINADIIMPDLPLTIDQDSFKIEIKKILTSNSIDRCNVFRNIGSSMLFRMSSLAAAQLLNESDGFIGEFKIELTVMRGKFLKIKKAN